MRKPAFILLVLFLLPSIVPKATALEAPETVRFSVSRLGGPALDPHRVQGDLELHLFPNIFEGLVKIDPETGELVPALATSYRWLDPETVEFDLRRGVKFHNGEPFDAAAVKFSFERMAAVEDGFNWVEAIIPEFREVEVVDTHRVRIRFSAHNSIFLISSRFFVILPPELLRKEGIEAFLRRPVGSGPFAVETIDYGGPGTGGAVRRIGLVRNADYWAEGLPRIDRLEFNFGLGQQESLELLLAGELDAMGDLPIRRILDARKAGLDVRAKGQGLLSWLYFNLTSYKRDTPIWSEKVRRAIMHAIDYRKILKVVYRNRARVNHQWAFPGLPGYVEELQNYAYDPALARMLLVEAGYSKGFSLNVYCDDVSLDEAKILKSSLAKVGIRVSIEVVDEATNNGILTSRRNPASPHHDLLKHYDMMIGDFGWGLPHNYVSHLHTFSLDSFASMVADDYPGASGTVGMFDEAKRAFGEEEADRMWERITAYELSRLSVAGLVLKETYFAARPELDWKVYGSYDFSKASYR